MAQTFCNMVLLLQASFIAVFSGNRDDCRYWFTEQPSSSTMCNPYPTGKLVLRCAVEFSTTDGNSLNLVWYHRNQTQNASESQQIQTGFVTQTYTASSIKTQLTIQLWRKNDNMKEPLKESTAYFCRATFANGTVLSDSQEIQLFPQHTQAPNEACDGQKIHSARTRKCIEQPQRSEGSTSVPPSRTATMNEPSVPPSRTATMNKPMKNNSADSFASFFNDEILLYFVIGAVILLLIVIFMLVFCLCVCNRMCKHSEYCTCCV